MLQNYFKNTLKIVAFLFALSKKENIYLHSNSNKQFLLTNKNYYNENSNYPG